MVCVRDLITCFKFGDIGSGV